MGKIIIKGELKNTIELSKVTDDDFIIIRTKYMKPLGMIVKCLAKSEYYVYYKEGGAGIKFKSLKDLILHLFDIGYVLTVEN